GPPRARARQAVRRTTRRAARRAVRHAAPARSSAASGSGEQARFGGPVLRALPFLLAPAAEERARPAEQEADGDADHAAGGEREDVEVPLGEERLGSAGDR